MGGLAHPARAGSGRYREQDPRSRESLVLGEPHYDGAGITSPTEFVHKAVIDALQAEISHQAKEAILRKINGATSWTPQESGDRIDKARNRGPCLCPSAVDHIP